MAEQRDDLLKKPEPDDPMEIMGVEVSGPAVGEGEGLEAMGRAFIEEFLMAGWGPDRLMAMFQNAAYQGPHLVYRHKGEAFVRNLIEEYVPVGVPVQPGIIASAPLPGCGDCAGCSCESVENGDHNA